MKRARLSGFLGIRGKRAIQTLLALDIVVGLLGLGFGMGTETQAVASLDNFRVAVQAVPAQRLNEVAPDGSAPQEMVRLSAAEFAIALRDGRASFGTWDPETKAFVVERAGVRPAPI